MLNTVNQITPAIIQDMVAETFAPSALNQNFSETDKRFEPSNYVNPVQIENRFGMPLSVSFDLSQMRLYHYGEAGHEYLETAHPLQLDMFLSVAVKNYHGHQAFLIETHATDESVANSIDQSKEYSTLIIANGLASGLHDLYNYLYLHGSINDFQDEIVSENNWQRPLLDLLNSTNQTEDGIVDLTKCFKNIMALKADLDYTFNYPAELNELYDLELRPIAELKTVIPTLIQKM